MKKWILRRPAYDDLVTLLTAWRVWVGGAIAGAILATIIHVLAPLPYRAQATVVVDQNVEKVIPAIITDLLRDTYLARQSEILVDIAWSDQTLQQVSSKTGLTVAQLRDGRLHLTQPSEGGWNFLADSRDPNKAAAVASAWAEVFYEEVRAKPEGVSPVVEVIFTRQENLPTFRTVSNGAFVFGGALAGIVLTMFIVLFVDTKNG